MPIYCTGWECRALNNNTNNRHTRTQHTHACTHTCTHNTHTHTHTHTHTLTMLWCRKFESTHRLQHTGGFNYHSKGVTQTQHQRPLSPMVTLTWHTSKYKVPKLHRRYILRLMNTHFIHVHKLVVSNCVHENK